MANVPREVSGRGGHAADFPRDVCLTESRNHAVFLLCQITQVILITFEFPVVLMQDCGALENQALKIIIKSQSVPKWRILTTVNWWVWYIHIYFNIQIKICAEYRDMLPRPRLVCQEPGLRPIGRSPGVPDKSSRGLGSMSLYSAQVLICFIAYILLNFFHSSVGLVGNFAGLPVCTVPSAIVHCNQNEAGHQTIKVPSMPCWDAAGWSKHSLAFKSQPGENDR